MKLAIYTTQILSRSSNSIVHCQQLKNLTGSSLQDKKEVLGTVKEYPQGLLRER